MNRSTASRQPGEPNVQVPSGSVVKKLAPKTDEVSLKPREQSTIAVARDGGDRPIQLFEFINTTTDAQYSGPGSRSAARSHVMRNFHRLKEKPRPKRARLQGQTARPSLLAIPQDHQVRPPNRRHSGAIEVFGQGVPALHRPYDNATGSEEDVNRSHDSAVLVHMLQRQRPSVMPMRNLWGLPISPHAGELIYHYIQIFARSYVPMSQKWESEWFRNALSDAACYHGTLFLSAAHKALLTGSADQLPLECFQHKGEAIRIINKRLGDPRARVTDETIAAVACLAAFETVGGSTLEASIHVDGLEKLVNMRGGLKQLGMDGFLAQFLYWVDLSNATAVRGKPHFLPSDFIASDYVGSDSGALWGYCNNQWDQASLVDLPMKSIHGLDLVENHLFHRLRQLAAMVESNPSTADRRDQQSYMNSVLLLERQISVAVQERLALKARLGELAFNPPTCLFYIPALVCCYMILRPTPVQSSIYGQFVQRMKDNIDRLTPRQLFDRFHPNFWFWALMFVGAVSIGRPEQQYFQRATARLCGLVKVQSWEDAKEVMREFVWADSVTERPCKAFWDALQSLGDVRGLG